jgi:hypothetical protein
MSDENRTVRAKWRQMQKCGINRNRTNDDFPEGRKIMEELKMMQ